MLVLGVMRVFLDTPIGWKSEILTGSPRLEIIHKHFIQEKFYIFKTQGRVSLFLSLHSIFVTNT